MCVYKKDVCEYHPATENLYSVNQFYGKGYTTFSITSSWRLLELQIRMQLAICSICSHIIFPINYTKHC